MSGQFIARCDPDRDLILYRLDGFFGADDLGAIQAERQSAHALLRCPLNQHLVLCDVTSCKIQSQGVLAMFRMIVSDERTRARRLAFFAGQSPVRMQIRRIRDAEPQRIGVFDTIEQAEAWLFATSAVSIAA